MDGTSVEAVVGPSAVAVCRRLDALAGWPRRLWATGTAAAVVVGLVVAASGHLLAGTAWVVLSLAAWGTRAVLAAQSTEIGPTSISLRGLTRARTIEAGDVRCVDLVLSEFASSRIVVHGPGSLGIAVSVPALESDPELAAALRRFLGAVTPGTPVAAEAAALRGPGTAPRPS